MARLNQVDLRRPGDNDDPTQIVEAIYPLADVCKLLEDALTFVPLHSNGGSAEFDALAEKPLFIGDVWDFGRKARAIADAWQEKLDREGV